MLAMVHTNPVRLRDGVLLVDRKFHTGMHEYLRQLDVPLLSIHPEMPADQNAGTIMDAIEVPEREIGYRLLTVADASGVLGPRDRQQVGAALREARLVYGGGLGTLGVATGMGVPVVGMLEYNLKTTIVFATAGVANPLRRTLKVAGAVRYYAKNVAPLMRRSTLLHCNGYPVYEEAAWLNPRRLLYLDSRMRKEMVISEEELEARLRARPSRTLRLLFSGRFELAKGVLETIRVAAECQKQGLDFELHLYGHGSQRAEMDRVIKQNGLEAKVVVHEPVPFPELVEIARGFDVFICCHTQDDPSCTYIESLGCGLPIAGYANAMWRSMHTDCRAGVATPQDASALATELVRLVRDHNRLDAVSRTARTFALQHTFEREFTRRTDSLKDLYYAGARRVAEPVRAAR